MSFVMIFKCSMQTFCVVSIVSITPGIGGWVYCFFVECLCFAKKKKMNIMLCHECEPLQLLMWPSNYRKIICYLESRTSLILLNVSKFGEKFVNFIGSTKKKKLQWFSCRIVYQWKLFKHFLTTMKWNISVHQIVPYLNFKWSLL